MKYKLKIIQDEMAESPRREWDNLGTMYCKHRNYSLGDKDADDIRDEDGEGHCIDSSQYIYLPLYLYDHSGLTMNTTGFSCHWDSCQVGYIYASKEKIRREYGWKHLTKKRIAKIKEYLVNEVAIYDQYLRGDVYGFKLIAIDEIETGDGVEDQEHESDSCWGFFGSDPVTNGIADHLSVPLNLCEIEYEYR